MMKKRLAFAVLVFGMMLALFGCKNGGEEVTLELSFGSRTGTYTGDMVDGVPNGQGKFTTENDAGESWTYEGEFKNGHFEGEGKTTWDSGQVEVGTYKNDVLVPMTGDDIKSLFTTPEDLKNHCVELVGKVFSAPEYGDGVVSLQMWTDYANSENNIIVYILDDTIDVNVDDYVRVVGIVGDVVTGVNAFGAELTVPSVTASEYEILSYKDAVAPTVQEYELGQSQSQYGYTITVEKVEFAEIETRVYVKVDNGGKATFDLYSFNTVVTQNGKQYETQDNWEADYPEIQSNLYPGVSTEGVIVYPPMEQQDFQIIFDAYSDDYHEEIEKYVFDVTIP